ncbi:hypothetical protein BH09BAC1_BH09BAC1_17440 [soil metagenome]
MRMLNVGCGTRFHKDWTNVDMVSTGEGVIATNLLKGIPYPDNTFDVVYHSHVLEHFNRADGENFTKECVRVLKPGGILRISTPDLENIAQEYIANLNAAIQGDRAADFRYEWNLLELYDQTTRNISQGEMGKLLKQTDLPSEEYVMNRIGYEGVLLRKGKASGGTAENTVNTSLVKKLLNPNIWRNKLAKVLLGKDGFRNYELGSFRYGGEIHLMMYDRHSAGKLLKKLGMNAFEVTGARKSSIVNWEIYDLDRHEGMDYKPFSLIVEARKS